MPSFMRRVGAGTAAAGRGAPSASAAPAQEAVARKVRRGSFIFDFGLPVDEISHLADFQAEKQRSLKGLEYETMAELKLLLRSHDGLYCETNSLSRRSGERVRERGAREIRDRFQAICSRFSPLPGPLPARSSRGEGEDEAPPAPRAFVVHPTDSSARRFLRFLRRPLRNSYGFRFQNFPGMVRKWHDRPDHKRRRGF